MHPYLFPSGVVKDSVVNAWVVGQTYVILVLSIIFMILAQYMAIWRAALSAVA